MSIKRKYYYSGIYGMIYAAKAVLPDYSFNSLMLSVEELIHNIRNGAVTLE